MSFGGRVVSLSRCATRQGVEETGLIGSAGPTRRSLPIGLYVMAAAEHREPCDSRGSCTVLVARGGETPPRDSTIAWVSASADDRRSYPDSRHSLALQQVK